MPLPITETHNNIICVIPKCHKQLINDLESYIIKVTPRHSDKKYTYKEYLRILLTHMPNRPLKNKDPQWMWDCQELFSSGFHHLFLE